MEILKENYRNFEIEKLIYLGPAPSAAPTATETVEAPKDKPESTEDLAEADVSGKIKEKETKVKTEIDKIRKNYDGHEHESAANQFADKMETHTETKFLELQQNYIEQANTEGRANFETTSEYKTLLKDAEALKTRILSRLGEKTADKFIQFEHEQDEAENITNKKEKREALDTAKANLVDSHLAEKFPNMNATARKMISELVVSELGIGFDGDLDKGSSDSYMDAIDDFMQNIDEEIGKGKSVDDALIQGFLEQMPSNEATEEEKEVFRNILLERPEIRNIGTESEHLEKVLTALATQFDARPKDGNPKYFIDITTNKVYGIESIEGVEGIDTALDIVLNNMGTQDATDTYQKKLNKKTDELRRYRKDLDTGWAGAYGGEIDNWQEWEEHKGVEYLVALNDKIQKQVNVITEIQDQQELLDADKTQETARETAYQNAIVEADFYENHLTVEGYTIIDNPDTDDLIDTVTLSQEGGGVNAVITLDCTGTPKVIVEIKGSKYTETHEYTPEQFKEIRGEKLQTLIATPERNLSENQAKVRSVGVKMNTLNDELQTATKKREGGKISLDLDSIQPAVADVQTLIEKDITATMPVKVGDQVVGTVQINLATFDATNKNSPVTIDSFGKKAQTTIEEVVATIQSNADTMVEEAKRAEGNKTEIDTQVDANITSIGTVTGMTVEKMGEYEGNLAEPKADISVIQIKKGDELVATVQVKAGTPAEEGQAATPREYIVIHQNPEMENKVCTNAAELKTHLTDNADSITPKPKPYSEDLPDAPVELDSSRQSAKDNLVKVMVKLYPDLVPEELKEGGAELSALPRLESAINAFVNELGATRLGELQSGDALDSFKPTKTERANLVAAIKEAYGHDESLKSSSEKEMKLINSLTVTINGQEKTFSEAFGENLAHIVSMRCETAGRASDKKQVIKLEGAEDNTYTELTPENIKQFLPEEMQEAYQEILDGGDATEFKKIAEAEKLTMENFQKLQEMLANPEKLDAFKKMGFFELFATLGEIFSMMQEAFKTKDFSTLHDVLLDIQQGKKPGEGLKSAKESYEDKLSGVDNVTQLLKYYHDPNGKEASKLFMDEGKRIPYRTSVKAIIRGKLESALGATIDTEDVEQLPGGNQTKITALKGEQKFEITIEANRVTLKEIKVEGGKTIKKDTDITNAQFNGLKRNQDSLANVLRFSSPTADQIQVQPQRKSKARLVTETIDPNAETVPIKEGSVLDSASGLVTKEADGTITIGSNIGESEIQNILDINNVESAVIVTKKGREMTVTQGPVTEKGKEKQTFYFEASGTKRRVRLYGGEKIKSTTLKKKAE